MHRLTRLPVALLAAAGLGLGSLLPLHAQSAKALDFWDWDGPGLSTGRDGDGGGTRTEPVDPRPNGETPVVDHAPAPRPAGDDAPGAGWRHR